MKTLVAMTMLAMLVGCQYSPKNFSVSGIPALLRRRGGGWRAFLRGFRIIVDGRDVERSDVILRFAYQSRLAGTQFNSR